MSLKKSLFWLIVDWKLSIVWAWYAAYFNHNNALTVNQNVSVILNGYATLHLSPKLFICDYSWHFTVFSLVKGIKKKKRNPCFWGQNECSLYSSCNIDHTTWVSNTLACIARRKPLPKRRLEALAKTHWLWKKMLPSSPLAKSSTDPNCAPESVTSVSTSGTGSHVHDGVVTLRRPPSAIPSLLLLLVLISWVPYNKS